MGQSLSAGGVGGLVPPQKKRKKKKDLTHCIEGGFGDCLCEFFEFADCRFDVFGEHIVWIVIEVIHVLSDSVLELSDGIFGQVASHLFEGAFCHIDESFCFVNFVDSFVEFGVGISFSFGFGDHRIDFGFRQTA